MTLHANPDWPVLARYDQDHLLRVAMPLGGIGTGTVSLGGRGDLRDWEIMNRPAKGFTPDRSFFALWAKPAGGPAATKALEGPIEEPLYEGSAGAVARNHGLPRFRRVEFAAAYPLAQVLLSDPDLPLDARIEAFNPLVPGDPDASGVPAAVLRFALVNRTSRPVDAAVCGSIENFIGLHDGGPQGNTCAFREGRRVRGLFLASEGVDPRAESFGTLALVTTAKSGVTFLAPWPADRRWSADLLRFWDDFSDDGRLDDPGERPVDPPRGSVAVRLRVPPRATRTVTFLLAWRFPNRRTWTPAREGEPNGDADCIGNYYATQYADAWDAAEKTAGRLAALEKRTVEFVRAFCESDLPREVKEAALFNLSTLRTQTCFRTADGRFYGWEGCHDSAGCCPGSCTHVWNYEQATAFLFGSLARGMREVEFLHATDERGHMCFRVGLPLERSRRFGLAAADGQMGCLLKLYREWRLCGDDAWLRQLWPAARRALEFCWIPGGWDADQDGVMEGCQHNTMDVEYYGPNPQMTGWYLAALRAAEEMARRVGDDAFADRCRRLFESGSRWMDDHLFNGEYYEHEIRPAAGPDAIAPGLRHGGMGAQDVTRPDLQLGAGCLVDQLVGQFFAHVVGLGYLLRPARMRKTLRSIFRYNRRRGLFNHFNPLRTFALNDETALLMASYPRGRRPERPFPYFGEVMTGFEYTAAVGMLYEGLTREGLQCIRDIRARYDGRKRNPFDEAECGHHYARAMTSWAAALALTGFQYDAAAQSLEFAAASEPVRWFWSNGDAWGVFEQRPGDAAARVTLRVLRGAVKLRRLALRGFGAVEFDRPRRVSPGKPLRTSVPREGRG